MTEDHGKYPSLVVHLDFGGNGSAINQYPSENQVAVLHVCRNKHTFMVKMILVNNQYVYLADAGKQNACPVCGETRIYIKTED